MNIDLAYIERMVLNGYALRDGAVVYYRTIKSGTVKIAHKIYIPSSGIIQYDGRLDGMRYAFFPQGRHMIMPMTEIAWRMALTPYLELFLLGPETVDGESPWRHWHLR